MGAPLQDPLTLPFRASALHVGTARAPAKSHGLEMAGNKDCQPARLIIPEKEARRQ